MNGGKTSFLNEHREKIAGGLVGLVLALLFVVFGFWKGLFVIAFILAGAFVGSNAGLCKKLMQLLNSLWYRREG